MTTTVNRPAALPPRAVPPAPLTASAATGRKPLPAGAAAWSRTYVDAKGLPQKANYPVPVDADGRRTEHVRHICAKGHIEVDGLRQPCDQAQWLLPGENGRFCPDHGCPLTADEQQRTQPLPWAALWRSVEPSARPLWVLLAELAAGIGVHAAQVPWWQPAVATPVLAGGAYVGTREFLTRRAVRRGRLEKGQKVGRRVDTYTRRARTAGYVATSAGVWLTGVAATDPTTPAGKVTWVSLPLLLAGAVPWWRHVNALRNRQTPPAPITSATVQVGLSADQVEACECAKVWDEEVAYPGTRLDPASWKRIKGGWQAVVVATKRGALNSLGGDNMKATIKRIAGGFDVTRAAIGWIDEYEGSPNRALLLVQPDSPLKDNITWQPPGLLAVDDAFLHLGMRIDGSPLRTRMWQPGWGAPGRWLVGTKGSGKTEALRLLLLGMLEAQVMGPAGPRRLVAPFLHDPKRGKDFGAYRRQVSGFSTTPDCLHMIVEAIIREMDRRYDALGSDVWFDEYDRPREGETAFDPSVHGPIISLVVDEFHEPAKDQLLMAKLEPMARKMRAGGIEVVAASHMSTISDSGSQVFRDMLAGGEAWLFRTTSGLNAALATGGQLVGDPRGLPREPGSVLHAAGDDDTMQARMAYVPSEPLYNRLYDERNRSRILPVEWPAETLEAFGPDFVEWMRACQARQPGESAPATPKAYVQVGGPRAATVQESAGAEEALLRVLFDASSPMARKDIEGHPSWRWGMSTATNVLRKTQDDGRVRKLPVGKGTFELTADARERMAAERSEQLQLDLAEQGAA